jgi:hypothetical protein
VKLGETKYLLKLTNELGSMTKPGSVNEGRRFLLKCAAGIGALAVLDTILPPDRLNEHQGNADDTWAFLEKREVPDGNKLIDRFLKRGDDFFVPVGSEIAIFPGSADWLEMRKSAGPNILAMVKQGKITGSPGDYSEWGTERLYGLPDEQRYSNSVIRYAGMAVDFLYERIRGLDERYHCIEWVPLTAGQDYSADWTGKGFVGLAALQRHRFGIVRKGADEKDGSKRITGLDKIRFRTGGFYRKQHTTEEKNPEWCIFISTDRQAVCSVFAEVIPLTTTQATFRYYDEAGPLSAARAAEALEEAISLYMAREIIKEYNIPCDPAVVEDKLNSLQGDGAYTYVFRASEWIAANGCQNAFELYMKSPKKFMEAIMAY